MTPAAQLAVKQLIESPHWNEIAMELGKTDVPDSTRVREDGFRSFCSAYSQGNRDTITSFIRIGMSPPDISEKASKPLLDEMEDISSDLVNARKIS